MSFKRFEYHNVSSPDLSGFSGADIAIELKGVTKDYGRGRGIFDVSFVVPRGKTFGYCGMNRSGKTTTLRHVMGFIRQDGGSVSVNGMDAWKCCEKIKSLVGYVPGEISFPAVNSGVDFLRLQAEMMGLSDMRRAEEIINILQLDPTASLKRMSKGMKQKTAITAALMGSPEILILDEPATGLDPLMRSAFRELIRQEKARGTTILMSDHTFEELDDVCDYIGFLKDGSLLNIVDMQSFNEDPRSEYIIGFCSMDDMDRFNTDGLFVIERNERELEYVIGADKAHLPKLFGELKRMDIRAISERKYDLKSCFIDCVSMQNGKRSVRNGDKNEEIE